MRYNEKTKYAEKRRNGPNKVGRLPEGMKDAYSTICLIRRFNTSNATYTAGNIIFPKKYAGKRMRIKIEMID